MYRHAAFLFLIALPLHAGPLPPPLTDADFTPVDMGQAKIGQLLFHDKILSGNRNIACSTCHSLDFGSTDGLSLGIGEGGDGLGPERRPGTGADRIAKRVPRNSSALWNLGARDVHTLFHDGRLRKSDIYGNGFDSPAEEWLPKGLKTPLAAQALFPLTAQFEMAGNPSENEISGAVHDRIDAAWPILAKRVRTIPTYGDLFVEHFDHVDAPRDVTIVDVGNALGAYMSAEFRTVNTPFDDYLSGDETALTAIQREGMELFYGRAGCDGCHAGPLLSDQKFHALALPQIGPGRTRRFDPLPRDVGRMGKTDDIADAYRFRTPMLRNVALTAPYGHNGAYPDLRGIIAHHADPLSALDAWTPDQARLPDVPWLAHVDFAARTDRLQATHHRAALDVSPVALDGADLDALAAFLRSLTERDHKQRPFGKPLAVPSGLPID